MSLKTKALICFVLVFSAMCLLGFTLAANNPWGY
jgi:hypothetical protein